MASLFVIHEKNTNTFCTSSKFASFSSDLQEAAMFNSRKNAEKAAKKMFAGAEEGINTYGGWRWTCTKGGGPVQNYHHAHLNEYIEYLKKDHQDNQHRLAYIKMLEEEYAELRCDLEVLEVKLTIV